MNFPISGPASSTSHLRSDRFNRGAAMQDVKDRLKGFADSERTSNCSCSSSTRGSGMAAERVIVVAAAAASSPLRKTPKSKYSGSVMPAAALKKRELAEEDEEEEEAAKAGKPSKTSRAKELAIFSVTAMCLRRSWPRPRSDKRQLSDDGGGRERDGKIISLTEKIGMNFYHWG